MDLNWKIKFIFQAILIAVTQISFAQNAVVNNSFESYSALPAGPGEWWKVNSWNNVNNVAMFAWPYASPDYLSLNGSGQARLPNSIFGTVNPFSGNAVMGFVTYYNPGAANFREYISQPLSTPMIIGQTYTVSFMLTNGSSNQYCGSGSNHIGVHFSLSPLTQLQHEPINVIPQCELSTVWWSTSWQLVSFTYTATAAYRYITIGNFYSDANTLHTVFNAASNSSYGAYYFIDEVIVQPAIPLPAELISFYGENTGNINHLYWVTVSELNNDHFEIERSAAGTAFEKIGTIPGHGNCTQTVSYELEDADPHAGINYYRLKQVDYNGVYKHSEVIAVKNKLKDNAVTLSATSEKGIYVLHYYGMKSVTVKITDMLGHTVRTDPIENSVNELQLDLRSYADGIFFLSVSGGEEFYGLKIFKY